MWWVIGYVVLGVVSIAVLGLLALRLWQQVRRLGRDVAAAGDRISRATAELGQITPPRR
ncbi:MAG TPA: hypothetical protein VFJ98_02865 [Mycobacteriales bacterium]|nr:hypothetical protein [Mycobacteriales bacterium]